MSTSSGSNGNRGLAELRVLFSCVEVQCNKQAFAIIVSSKLSTNQATKQPSATEVFGVVRVNAVAVECQNVAPAPSTLDTCCTVQVAHSPAPASRGVPNSLRPLAAPFGQILCLATMRGTSSIDPSSYASLALTHVRYDPNDPIAKILSLVTLSPIFLLCAYVTIILYRRELTFINALLGQLSCEALNWLLKRLFRQPRPTDHLGSGYGMPSSHSQFLGFFAAFFLAHFYINSPPQLRPPTLINTMRRIEHGIAMLLIALIAVLTCYSRYHLHYHTPLQIGVGASLGLAYGGVYYYFTEYLSRKPLRLPAPLGVGANSSPIAIRANKLLSPRSVERNQDTATALRNRKPQPPTRRRSLSDKFMPELHPAPPLRQMILDHPIAVAFRLRDGWTVWKDGGIEGEYGAWRREWERLRRTSANANASPEPVDEDTEYQVMLAALREADKSEPLITAFCVGCIITTRNSSVPLATGYSRELPGNTHAEQCALDKLTAPPSGRQLDLYATMEPCSERLSGNLPCVQRIIAYNKAHPSSRITRVFQGVQEPDDFVLCKGTALLRDAGVQVITVLPPLLDNLPPNWLEKECLRIAKKGHKDEPQPIPGAPKIWQKSL